MLNAIAELGQNLVRHVERILRHEIDPDPLRADQPHDLLDLVEQRLRRIVEQQMRLVEEKAELGLGLIADLGQFLEQLREQPQQKGGVEPRILHQFVRSQNIDVAAPVAVGANEVLELERRLAEQVVAALVLQHQQLTLDGPDRGLRHISVLGGKLAGMIGEVAEHRAEILEIEDEKPLLIGDAETDVQHTLLDLVEVQQP